MMGSYIRVFALSVSRSVSPEKAAYLLSVQVSMQVWK